MPCTVALPDMICDPEVSTSTTFSVPLSVVVPVTPRVPLAVMLAAANVPVIVGAAEKTRLPVPVAPVGVTPSMVA